MSVGMQVLCAWELGTLIRFSGFLFGQGLKGSWLFYTGKQERYIVFTYSLLKVYLFFIIIFSDELKFLFDFSPILKKNDTKSVFIVSK